MLLLCLGCCSTTDINRLQKLQNRAIRIIANSAFDTSAKPLLACGSSLRNTDRDLKLPLKQNSNGRRGTLSEEQKLGMVSAGAKRVPSLAPFKSYL